MGECYGGKSGGRGGGDGWQISSIKLDIITDLTLVVIPGLTRDPVFSTLSAKPKK